MTKKILMTSAAMFITALGLSFAIQSDIGLNPLWTLTSGLSQHLNISLGMIFRTMSFLMILVAFLLGKKPGIATFLDMILIGLYVDLIGQLPWPTLHKLPVKILVAFLGIMVFCLGITLTMKIGLGVGPKDTFTLALKDKMQWTFGRSKLIVEVSILVTGLIIGGPVGLGTIMAALMPGYIIEKLLNVIKTPVHA